VWIHLISHLDGNSLRNTLLVNKEWYRLGTDPKLTELSGREIVEKFNQFEKNNFHQRMIQLFDRESKDFNIYLKKTRGMEKYLKTYRIYSSLCIFLPHLTLLFLGGIFNYIFFSIFFLIFILLNTNPETWNFST
jgi:hypothetical protein